MQDLIDLHSHTIASGHAYNTIMEMAAAAEKKKLKMYGISEHGPKMMGSCNEIYFLNLKAIDRNIFPLEMLFGVELNIIDFEGKVDLKPGIIKRTDYTIASLHIPTIAKGTKEDYTRAVIGAIENPLVNIIGHPDDDRFPLDLDAVTTAAKENGKVLELNNSSLVPGAARQNARENDLILLEYCRKKNVPILMGSDAHFYTKVGEHSKTLELLEEVDFPEELVLNTSVEKIRPYLNKYNKI